MKILIIGASGMIAQQTIKELSKAGNELRLFSRGIKSENYPGHEVTPGDVLKKSDLENAIRGCDAIHITINTPDEALAVQNIVDIAKRNNIKRISYVSGATVCKENSWFTMVGNKYKAEQLLKSSGIPYMIFRPTWFMESLDMMIQNGKANVMGKQPLKIHWISAKDFAKQLSSAYAIEESLNQEFYSYGPEKFTLKEALEQYIKVRHPNIKKVANVPFGLLKFIAFITGNKELKNIIPMFEYFEKTKEVGSSDDTNSLLGQPSITLSDWLIQ
ncbi:SDR family oxidoreductase [Arenibacter troitsensis]|uniref:Uncharacterized conserved protein YbjT, contains NAD(P)-binding and DUF2867 domains n=1 Tax=Arenibacter troitsensis TaxID=188872 RepID=A0A1X7IQ65_9FLAO|nr:NAD(P)H-binding protein [Arenibacter troitsensis]SMG17080.1 Uncharacterized conserved protein YbjT, contains NAD(P)-binding and DUF2867 domains [Arenibacter troitsensis]